MYLKNPNPKVSYSFRIDPDTLEELKLYAKATNKTVPEVLNYIITEKLDGVTLTNDYLNYFQDQLITIPDLQTIYENSDTVHSLEVMDLQNPFLKGTIFKVKKIPNNLDVWDTTDDINGFNQHGYTSYDYPNTDHEGIEFVLAPELITEEIVKRDKVDLQLMLTNTVLLYIWFKVNFNNTLTIELITFREAVEKIKRANNFTLLDKLTHFKTLTAEVINELLNSTPDTDRYEYLQIELGKLKSLINTGNIVVNNAVKHNIKYDTIEFKVDDTVMELMEENQALKDRVQELESKIDNIDNIIDSTLGKKLLKKIEELGKNPPNWEDIKHNYDQKE